MSADPPLTRAQLRAKREAEAAARAAEAPAPGGDEGIAPGHPGADLGRSQGFRADGGGSSEERASVRESDARDDPPAVPPAPGPIEGRGAAPAFAGPPRDDDADAATASVRNTYDWDAEPAPPAPPATRSPGRRFTVTLLAVLGVLVLAGGVLTAVSLQQGPRIVSVQSDPTQAIETAGSRVVLTANAPLAVVDPEQITVEPAAPFTVDASGRDVGVRFAAPLDDSTTYTITVADAARTGGGPAADLTTSFTTPEASIFLLQRGADTEEEVDDTIFRTGLSGEGTPVFRHPRITDFRATPTALVVLVEQDETSRLLVMRRDGSDQRELRLPGRGFVRSLQVSDRGGLVGYQYSDAGLTETEGRASVLVVQSLSGADEPRIVEVAGAEAGIADWRFVPESSSMLFIDFNSELSLEDPTTDRGVRSLGLAARILGATGGTPTAIVERTDGSLVSLNLTDGAEEPIASTEPDYGPPSTIVPFPGGTLRHVVQRDAAGMPTGQAVIRVDENGAAAPIMEVSGSDAILQACASPSGRYAAVVVAPDLASNPYDQLQLPLPTTLHTRLVDIESGEELVTLNGFDSSWCRTAPLL